MKRRNFIVLAIAIAAVAGGFAARAMLFPPEEPAMMTAPVEIGDVEETVLVCLIGGVLGIGGALGFGVVFGAIGSNFSLVYSPTSIAAAFVCSSLIGVVFGYLPARNASQLDPVVALARD